jgi:histone RNA hairpin-binding protein
MEYKKTKFDDDCERFRTTSSSSGGSSNNSSKPPTEYETDQSILDRRQKQIEYGKNTIGYENYIAEVPIANRTKEHPKTPPKFIKFSRRGWDGLVKSWRKKLHCWDPENLHSSG